MIGTTISHYRITDQLGRGGMGVVYKAEDSKLDRTVALKILPLQALASEDERARFYREAKAAAALNHPNIATIFGIDEAVIGPDEETRPFIAMEFVDGQTLGERVAEGPLPMKDVVSIGAQIAKGLQEAHHKGIVHRDMKSGNVMLRKDGRAKILDFGLAMTAASTRLTQIGSTLGTAAYMSPEQARGEEVDHRSDLWSLGVVLYEMITGRVPFPGDYEQAIVYGILNAEPEPPTGIRTGVPMELERIVAKLLSKDRSRRYQNAADLIVDLESVDLESVAGSRVTHPTDTTRVAPADEGKRSRRPRTGLWVVIALAAFLAGAVASRLIMTEAERPLRKYQIPIADLDRFAVSPNGEEIAFAARGALWIRTLSDLNPRRLVDSIGVDYPFWSPEGNQIGFVAGGKLRKVAATGGAPADVCELPFGGFHQAVWTRDGTIYFLLVTGGATSEIFAVPERGGSPRSFLKSSSDLGVYNFDSIGPMKDGRSLLLSKQASDTDAPHVDVVTVSPEGTTTPLVTLEGLGATFPAYSPTGHLVFARGGALWAAPLSDAVAGGQPFPIASAAFRPSISQSGTLVYQSLTTGMLRDASPLSTQIQSAETEILWVDRDGQTIRSIGEAAGHTWDPIVSEDGSKVAVAHNDDVWLYSVDRDSRVRLTFLEGREFPDLWIPGSTSLIYTRLGGPGRGDIAVVDAEKAGSSYDLIATSTPEFGPDLTPDLKHLVYYHIQPETNRDLLYVPIEFDGGRIVVSGDPQPLVKTPFDEAMPAVSPDGRYVAYHANRTGRWEIYLTRFPDGRGEWLVSDDGGNVARWHPNGDELFFADTEGNLVSVDVDTSGEQPDIGQPRKLFNGAPFGHAMLSGFHNSYYGVGGDGEQFALVRFQGAEGTSALTIVENWFEEFRKR